MSNPIAQCLERYIDIEPKNLLVIKRLRRNVDGQSIFKTFLIDRKFRVRELIDQEIKREINQNQTFLYPHGKKLNKIKDRLMRDFKIQFYVNQYGQEDWDILNLAEMCDNNPATKHKIMSYFDRKGIIRRYQEKKPVKKGSMISSKRDRKNLVINWIDQITQKQLKFYYLIIIDYRWIYDDHISCSHDVEYRVIDNIEDLEKVLIYELHKGKIDEKLCLDGQTKVFRSKLFELTLAKLKEDYQASYYICDRYKSSSTDKIKVTYQLIELF